LVAPVVSEGVESRDVYLPNDEWLGLYDGAPVAAGWHHAAAPRGMPPVFVRAAAPMRAVLLALGREHAAAAGALA
jgi:alpha-glucosidase